MFLCFCWLVWVVGWVVGVVVGWVGVVVGCGGVGWGLLCGVGVLGSGVGWVGVCEVCVSGECGWLVICGGVLGWVWLRVVFIVVGG